MADTFCARAMFGSISTTTTTTRQFFSTKVQAVYEGGHTLDVWIDINDDGDTCWFGYGDYCNLEGMLGDYAYELPPIEDEAQNPSFVAFFNLLEPSQRS